MQNGVIKQKQARKELCSGDTCRKRSLIIKWLGNQRNTPCDHFPGEMKSFELVSEKDVRTCQLGTTVVPVLFLNVLEEDNFYTNTSGHVVF